MTAPGPGNRTQNVGMMVLGQGINTVVNFLFLPYLARSLSVERYGTYGQTLLIGDFIVAVFSVGIASTVHLQFSKARGDEGSVLKSALALSVFLGAAGGGLLAAAAPLFAGRFSNPDLTLLLRLYAAGFPFQVAFMTLNGALIYFGRVRSSVTVNIAGNLLRVALLFIAIHFFQSLPLAFTALLIAPAIQSGHALASLPEGLSGSGQVRRELLREFLEVGVPLGLTGVLGTVLLVTDGMMVSAFMSVREFAVYRVGALEVPFIKTVYASIGAVIFPEFSRFWTSRDFGAIVALKRKATTAAAIVVLPVLILIVFLHRPMIVAYFSDKYAQSATVFLVINMMLLVRLSSMQDVLIVSERTKTIFRNNLLCAGLNIALNLALIPRLGAVGAALATLASVGLLALSLLWESTRLLRVGLFDFYDLRDLGRISGVSAAFASVAYGGYNAYPTTACLVAVIVAYFAVTYAVLVFRLKLLDPSLLSRLAAKTPFFGRLSLAAKPSGEVQVP